MSAADTTTSAGTSSGCQQRTTTSAGTSSGCQQRTPPPATDGGQQLGTLGGVLGDDLSQPDTLGTSSRASGTLPGGPAAYLQQFRGKGEGVPIQ